MGCQRAMKGCGFKQWSGAEVETLDSAKHVLVAH
jgi:hypothetical protein